MPHHKPNNRKMLVRARHFRLPYANGKRMFLRHYLVLPVVLWVCLLFVAEIDAAFAVSAPAVEGQIGDKGGMVVSSQRLASQVGADILNAGGNAVDAAVAVGYALAVTNPCCGNIGGGGFMVLHLKDPQTGVFKDSFLNFREMAPADSTPTMYLDGDGNPRKGASLYGWLAAGVPGTVKGLDYALLHYGRLPRDAVMAPAIALARDGFVLGRGDTDILDAGAPRFEKNPTLAKIFLKGDGTHFAPGDRLVQTDLAQTLSAIAKDGETAFYHGAIAQRVEEAAKAGGGILTTADFAAYTITETAPVTCTYRGYTIISSPPPSSGGTTLCEILNILEGYDMGALGFHSAASVHVMVEAMRHAYFDRNTYLGDPAFVQNPLPRLLSKDYAAKIRAVIPADKAGVSKDIIGTSPHEKPETTHYSVMDKDGNAVSVTYTINGLFGAYEMAPGTGFLLNDEMDDFTIKPGVANLYGLVQGTANAIAPGKRPLSSMAPTLVTKDGDIFLVVGSPGGSRIITIVLETIINMVDYAMVPQQAVDAARIHHQWLPDEVFYEPFALSADTRGLLQAMGYKVTVQSPWGAAEMIAVGAKAPANVGNVKDTPVTSGNDAALSGTIRPSLIYGANDNRRPAGAAVGQ